MRLKHTILFRISFFLLFTCTVSDAVSQDIHFSQFYHTSSNLNPALTGVFAGDLRFIGNYRSQWQSVPVPYQTLSGAFDTKFFHKTMGKSGYLGWGVSINNDVAGDADLKLTQIGANAAYTRQLSDPLFISIGVQLMAGQRSASPEQLSFAEQWNGDEFDPNKPNTEAFGKTSSGLASVSSGINLHYQVENTRTKVDAGFGMFHLNEPNTTFLDDNRIKLPRKGNGYGMATIEVRPKWDLKLHGLFSKQTSFKEIVAGVAVRYHLNLEKHEELAVQAGISTRIGDALIPSILLQYRNWEAGISYDINHSPWKTASLKRGGPEFFLQYIIWKVQAPKEFKACPVF